MGRYPPADGIYQRIRRLIADLDRWSLLNRSPSEPNVVGHGRVSTETVRLAPITRERMSFEPVGRPVRPVLDLDADLTKRVAQLVGALVVAGLALRLTDVQDQLD